MAPPTPALVYRYFLLATSPIALELLSMARKLNSTSKNMFLFKGKAMAEISHAATWAGHLGRSMA